MSDIKKDIGSRPRGRPKTNRDPKDLRPRYEHVRMRFPDVLAARGQDATVSEMIKLAKEAAPQQTTAFNAAISGTESVPMRWLTLLSRVFCLTGISAEQWYELPTQDFFDLVDQVACHRPIDVLSAWARDQPPLELDIVRRNLLWLHTPPPATLAARGGRFRGIEVGQPSPAFPRAVVAPKDGLVLRLDLETPAWLTVLNVDQLDREAPAYFDLTPFLDVTNQQIEAGTRTIRLASGDPISIGDKRLGASRLFVLATVERLVADIARRPDGELTVQEFRRIAIAALRDGDGRPRAASHDYLTVAQWPAGIG